MTDDNEQAAVDLMEAIDLIQSCLGKKRYANRYLNMAIYNLKKAIDLFVWNEEEKV